MADNKNVQYNFNGSTEGLKAAADSAIQILGNVSNAESRMASVGSQSLSTFNAIRNVTSSITNNIAMMQKQLMQTGGATAQLALPAPQQQLALPAPTQIAPLQNALVPVKDTLNGITVAAGQMTNALTGSGMSGATSLAYGVSNAVANMSNVIRSSAASSRSAIEGETQAFQDAEWRAVDAAEGKQRFARSNEDVNSTARTSANAISGESKSLTALKVSLKVLMSPITATVKGLQTLGNGVKSLFSRFNLLKGSSSGLSSALKLLTGYTAGDFFGTAIKQSIDFVETLEMFQVACRNSMDAASEFVNQMQEAYGMDPRSIMDSAAYFYQLTAAIEAPIAASERMSLGLTKLSNDVASLFNMDVEKVQENLSSGMQGMSRAVTKYGMDIRKTTLQEYANKLGIQAKVAEMTEASRQGLRYVAMMNQAKAASGNWAKTIESNANQIRIFKEQMAQLGRSIGDFVTPALSRILPVVNGVIMALRTVLTYISAFVRLFKPKSFNQTTTAIGGAAGAYTGLGDAASGAASGATAAGKAAKKAAKEASKSVAAFDQINKLDGEDAAADAGAAGGGGGGGGLDMDGVMDPAILDAINGIDTSLESVRMKANDVRDSILKFLGFTSESGDFSIKFNYDTNEWESDIKWSAEQFKSSLIDKFPNWKQTINSIFSNWDEISVSFQNLWKTVGESIGVIVAPIKTALGSIFTDENMAAFFTNLSGYIDTVSGVLGTLAQALAPVVAGFTNGLAGFGPIFSAIGDGVVKISEAMIPLGQALGPVIEQFMLMAGGVIGEGIRVISDIVARLAGETLPMLAPILSTLVSTAGQLMSALMPLVSQVLNVVVDVLNQLIPYITQIVDAVLPPLMGLISALVPMLMSIIQTALPPLMALLDSIMQPLIRIITAILPIVINLIEQVMAPITTMINTILPPLISVIQAIIDPVMNIIERLLPPLVAIISNLLIPIIQILCTIISAVITVLAPVLEVIIAVADVILSILVGAIEFVINIINAVIEVIAAIITQATEVVNKIISTVSTILQTIGGMVNSIATFLRNLINMINDWVKSVWDSCVTFCKNIIEGIGNFAKGLWDLIDNIVKVILDFFKGCWDGLMAILEDIKSGFDAAWNLVLGVIDRVVNGISGFIGDLLSTIGGLLTYVGETLYKGWTTAWDNIKNYVSNIWDGISGAIKSGINFVIQALNTLIKGANKLSFDIPDWVPGMGGKKFGLNIPLIPTLADGGLLNSGQMFIAREAGPELVGNVGTRTAVMNNEQIVEAVSRGVERANQNVVQAIRESRGSGAAPKLVVDKRVLAQVVSEALNDYGRSLGYSTIGLR